MIGAGGRGTECGVMKRGAGLASAGRAAVLAAGAAGFGGTAEGGATTGRGTGGGVGRAGAAGCAARCVIAFSTSPGLEMCERSILGLNSSGAAADAREPRDVAGACSAKYFFTRSASSSSIELECVFFSVMPTLGRTSRISLLLTSSSRARSLIRTLCCIPPRFLRFVPSGYAFIASSRFWLMFGRGWPLRQFRIPQIVATTDNSLLRSLFARLFFVGNVLVRRFQPLVNRELGFIGGRRVLHTVDDLGFERLALVGQFLDALREASGTSDRPSSSPD